MDGQTTGLYFLHNGNLTAAITNYGARLVSLHRPRQERQPDRRGPRL